MKPTAGYICLLQIDCKSECMLPIPQSMVKVVRGRISEGTWTDEETIWSVHSEYYTPVPDGVAGGRLGFDKNGHIYISVGGKASYKHLHDMNTPSGKIHRVKDDGSAPEEKPILGCPPMSAKGPLRAIPSGAMAIEPPKGWKDTL